MAWLGIWFDRLAGEGGPRDPQQFRGLVPPIAYPFASAFMDEEGHRLEKSRDPGRILRDGASYSVYYSLDHDGGQGAPDAQGCRIVRWLFEGFTESGASRRAARFNEIPLVLHSEDPHKAAAMANALTILRFVGASPDQAVARILVEPWKFALANARLAAEGYERRVLDFLHGEIFYPEDVTILDVIRREDLRTRRELPPCCAAQIGFIPSILEWLEDCYPRTDEEREELLARIRRSLADEARTLRPRASTRPRRPRIV